MAAVLLLFLIIRVGKVLHMERWFIGGLIFWRPPNGEDVLSLLSIRESLLKRSGLVGGKNPKKQTSGAKKVSEEDFRDLRQRVVETLRRHADRTFSPGFDVLQQPAVRGGAPQTAAADLRDVFYHDEFSTLVSIGAYAVLLLLVSLAANMLVGLPRFTSVLFAAVALFCVAVYYLFGWVRIVSSSSIQLRGSFIAGAVGFVLALTILLAVPSHVLDFGIDQAIAESSSKLEGVAETLTRATSSSATASDAASADEGSGAPEEVAALHALVPVLRSSSWMKTVLASLAGVCSFVLFAPLFRFARHANFMWQRKSLGLGGSLLWTADVLGPLVVTLLAVRPLAFDEWGILGSDSDTRQALSSFAWLGLAGAWAALHLVLLRRRLQLVLSQAPSSEFCDLIYQVLRVDIDGILKSAKSKVIKNAAQARKRHESTEDVLRQLNNLIANRYNETYSQICIAAVQYLAPLAVLGAFLLLAFHEGPAANFVAESWRRSVMEPLGAGARLIPEPSKLEVLMNNLLQQGDAASDADRQWESYEGENPIGYAAAGASTQLGAIWELRTRLYQAMAHFLVWWFMLCTGLTTLGCTAYWSVVDRSGRLYDAITKIQRTIDAVDQNLSTNNGNGGGKPDRRR
eukprot:INCI11177.1.p1 GENE.INCI11177.1~~INCI11177.1.p1  ORF type:complete len:694 (+),score=98.58 INCI11177.1:197-2083(+)